MHNSQKLHLTTRDHLANGCSIIPLVGGSNPEEGKQPALAWKPYTQKPPTTGELFIWFAERRYQAYGIVCGKISNLIVLDLDEPEVALSFLEKFPNLLNTLIVRSGNRETPHIYWRTDFFVKTQKVFGGDLKAEGSYIVGPQSTIADKTWQPVTDHPIRTITRDELEQVLDFLQPEPIAPHQPTPPANTQRNDGDYIAIYRHRATTTGERNNTLFEVTRSIRDAGYPINWAIQTLAHTHAIEPQQNPNAKPEKYESRYNEAVRTINSVYSRPTQKSPEQKETKEPTSRLPNTLREAILKRSDGTALLRVIEALFLKGLQPGDTFTEPQIRKLLKGTVGRYSILRALKAKTSKALIFNNEMTNLTPPLATPPPANADIEQSKRQQKNAFLSDGQNQTEVKLKTTPHRPPKHYIFPSIKFLCDLFDVKPKGGDAIKIEDLQSCRTYKQALHREFLRRRPGQYSAKLLAHRLSTSKRTIRRYNKFAQITVTYCYQETSLTWNNINRVIMEEDSQHYDLKLRGCFLQDNLGNRYPPKRSIARTLLSKKRTVTHKVQLCNHYFYSDEPLFKRIAHAFAPPQFTVPQRKLPKPTTLSFGQTTKPKKQPRPHPLKHLSEKTQPTSQKLNGNYHTIEQPVHGNPTSQRNRDYHEPLTDKRQERSAMQVYYKTPELGIYNSRRLVETYGPTIVNQTLHRMVYLQRKGKIRNPAGFMIVASRATWRGETTPEVKTRHFEGQPKRKSRREKREIRSKNPD